MSAFKLELDTGNAAFDDDAQPRELARILRQLADELEEQADGWTGYSGPLFDVNGNRVGSFELEARPCTCGLVYCAACEHQENERRREAGELEA